MQGFQSGRTNNLARWRGVGVWAVAVRREGSRVRRRAPCPVILTHLPPRAVIFVGTARSQVTRLASQATPRIANVAVGVVITLFDGITLSPAQGSSVGMR